MNKLLLAPVAAGLMLMSPLCLANGPYFGASVLGSTYSEYEDVGTGTGEKIYAGYRVGGRWGEVMFEGGYLDIGKPKIDSATESTPAGLVTLTNGSLGFSGANFSVGYYFKFDPRGGSGAYAKLGGYTGKSRLHADFSGAVNGNFDNKESSSGLSIGAGVDWMFSRLVGLRFDIESLTDVKDMPGLDSSHKSDVTTFSLGLIMSFDRPPERRQHRIAAPAYQPVSAPVAPPAPAESVISPPAEAAAVPAQEPVTAPAEPVAPAPEPAAAPAPVVPPTPPAPPKAGTAQAAMGAVMRDQPTASGKVIQTLAKGGTVELISRTPTATGGWWWVRSSKATGWINESQLWLNTQ